MNAALIQIHVPLKDHQDSQSMVSILIIIGVCFMCTYTVSPDLTIVEPNSLSILVTEGESFTLNCQAPGWPAPDVQVTCYYRRLQNVCKTESLLAIYHNSIVGNTQC